MFSFFKKKPDAADFSAAPKDFAFLGTDIHSHLVPGIDDGAPDVDASLNMILQLRKLGYSKLITTPHIHLDFYNNNAEKITTHFAELKQFIDDQGLDLTLEVAAEYYLDNYFLSTVLPDGLLSFGREKYVLVEVSMAGWQRQFSDIIFTIQSQGYTPVLAHPERYLFEEHIKVYEEWKNKGMLLQMNLLALAGYYGPPIKASALRYMEHGLYDFCGSDAHHSRHLAALAQLASEQPGMMLKLSQYPHWRNNTL